jgi:hypothetical protein
VESKINNIFFIFCGFSVDVQVDKGWPDRPDSKGCPVSSQAVQLEEIYFSLANDHPMFFLFFFVFLINILYCDHKSYMYCALMKGIMGGGER